MTNNKNEFFLVMGDDVLGNCFTNTYNKAIIYFEVNFPMYSKNQVSEMVLTRHERMTKINKWGDELKLALEQVELT